MLRQRSVALRLGVIDGALPGGDVAIMLCENCHLREATCHLNITRDDDTVTRRDLCEQCFETKYPKTMALTGTNSDPRCEYCGAPADSGWEAGIHSADGTTIESHFACEECIKAGRTKGT